MIQLIKPDKPVPDYGQNPQTHAALFSFVNKLEPERFQQIFHPVICRDYLGDCVWGDFHNKTTDRIYGFSWHNTDHLDKDKVRLSLKYKKFIFENMKFLHEIEEINGFEKTELLQVADNVIIVEGDLEWKASVFRISLYSFLLKLFLFHKHEATNLESLLQAEIKIDQSVETSMLALVKRRSNFLEILKNLSKLEAPTISGWPEETEKTIGWIHNYSGFYSAITMDFRETGTNTINHFRTLLKENGWLIAITPAQKPAQ